ncbi:ACP S-malonyltransferase [Simkania negevensis]|uniref:Malonyl CoA-acyl carrier protein transacylase n=1 Tax=Simkania negevensis TaxID=83561 RepID=A0ABS3ARU3_9BACT|nr:ACP S-malonyltransferase [Simkania negevensis]
MSQDRIEDRKTAFLFPGQGAQYVGMGRDFYDAFPEAREVFDEADSILNRKLTHLIFEGPADLLTQTHNSQLAIYVTSYAMVKVLEKQLPSLRPAVCSGLSLGEYTALTAAHKLPFAEGMKVVECRATLMSQACEMTKGTMAAVLGMDADDVTRVVEEVALPEDLWVANYNCPGQSVISGTLQGVEAGKEALSKQGAKRVLFLDVHGAFHSGLMASAQEGLRKFLSSAQIVESDIPIVMNVPGKYVKSLDAMRNYMVEQLVSPVRWEQGVREIAATGVNLFIEIGPGRALTGMNKKMKLEGVLCNIGKVADLEQFAQKI